MTASRGPELSRTYAASAANPVPAPTPRADPRRSTHAWDGTALLALRAGAARAARRPCLGSRLGIGPEAARALIGRGNESGDVAFRAVFVPGLESRAAAGRVLPPRAALGLCALLPGCPESAGCARGPPGPRVGGAARWRWP